MEQQNNRNIFVGRHPGVFYASRSVKVYVMYCRLQEWKSGSCSEPAQPRAHNFAQVMKNVKKYNGL